MNTVRRFCIVFCIGAVLLVTTAQAQKNGTPYNKVVPLSLLGNTIGTTSADMQEHFKPLLEGLAPRPKTIFNQLLATCFHRDSLRAFAELYWRHHADTRKTQEAVVWLQTPLVQRIHKLHHQALQPSEHKKIAAFVQKALNDPTITKRRELVAAFIDKQAQATTDITIALTRQALAVLNTLPSEQQPLTEQEIITMAESMRPDILSYNQGTLEGLYLYVFRSVSEKDMQNYLGSYTSELGQWFAALQWTTYRQTCDDAALRFVWQLQQAYTTALQSQTAAQQEMPEQTTTAQVTTEPYEQPTQSAKAVSEALHKQAQGNAGRVLGVITATVNNKQWYGYFNAENNPDSTITLLALNTDTTPNEQIEVTFAFRGIGTYPIEAGNAAFYKVANGTATESYFSQGAKADRVVITAYDAKENIIEGSLVYTAHDKQKKVSFSAPRFAARIR